MPVKDAGVERTRDEMVDYLKSQDAFWHWYGHAHVAQLTSGKLSDFFVNLSPLYTNIFLQEQIGWALVYKAFYGNSIELQHDNLWVIGPAMGAIGLAQSVARAIRAYNPKVRCGFVEKTDPVFLEGVPGHAQFDRMILKRFDLGASPRVIIVEDVTTTGGTTRKTADAIDPEVWSDATVYNRVLTVIDRRADEGALPFVSLMRVRPRVWDSVEYLPPEMRRCTPVRPKESWNKLTTEYL